MNTRQNRGPQINNRDFNERFRQDRRHTNVNRENFQGYRNENNEDYGYFENERNREFENEKRHPGNRRFENPHEFGNSNRGDFGNMDDFPDQPGDERDYYDTGSYRHQGRDQGYYDQGFDNYGQNGNRYGQYEENNFRNDRGFGNEPFTQRNRGFEGMDRQDFREIDRRGSSQARHWPEDTRAYEDTDGEELDEEMDEETGEDTQETSSRTSRRGFASMDPEQVREIARMGGLSSHSGSGSRSQSAAKKQSKTSRRGFASMDPEKVRKIARLGGLSSHKNDGKTSVKATKATTAKSRSTSTSTAKKTATKSKAKSKTKSAAGKTTKKK